MASLYLHIPYCEKKCIYCDFYSIENMETMEQFLRALENEIVTYAKKYSGGRDVRNDFLRRRNSVTPPAGGTRTTA